MQVFIYKITNLITNKAYIGVAKDPAKTNARRDRELSLA